jgi:hypothetical protein
VGLDDHSHTIFETSQVKKHGICGAEEKTIFWMEPESFESYTGSTCM